MKTSLRHRLYHLGILLLIMLFPALSYSQTFIGESSNPADNGALTTATVTVTPVAAAAAGDLIVIYAHYRGNVTLSLSNAGGQTWTSETAVSSTNQSTRIFWCEFNGTWSSNPVVSGGAGTLPFTAVMYVFRHSDPCRTWDVHAGPTNAAPAAATNVTITGLATTVTNTVTMAFWGTPDDNTWGTLTGTGWTKTGLSTQIRNTGGTDQSMTAAYNIRATAGAAQNVSQTQSSSLAARTSIITFAEVGAQNGTCATNILLNTSTTCVGTAGTMFGAGTSGFPTISAPNCAGTPAYNVWYRFIATSTNQTITLSGLGAQFTTPAMQLLSGTCGGTMTSLYCATGTTLYADNLTTGNTYYIRVYSATGPVPTTACGGAFTICVTDPTPTPPPNDECAGAVTLPITGASCSSTIPGNVAGSTASTPTALNAACGGGNSGYDVWYKFTAVNSGTTTITLSGVGANFTNRRMEAYTGACGALVYNTCSNTNTMNVTTVSGTQYYVRVASTTVGSPSVLGNFSICATTSGGVPLRFGNSYVNISKRTSGGTVQPGDTLEIRMTINHTTGTVYFPRYVDNVPTNTTMVTTDPITIITNEGLVYKSYTTNDGVYDDAATYKASPGVGEYNVRMNLGFGSTNPGIPANNTAAATASGTGQLANSHNPRGGGGLLFATAFRVRVTGNLGDTINIYPGQFLYKTTNAVGAADVVLTATPYQIVISAPLDLCSNSIGVSIASETNGTFGSGTTLNRGADLAAQINNYTFVNDVNASNSVNDGRYAIVKNISPRSGTNTGARFQNVCDVPAALPATDPLNCNNRMFGGFWDIGGDHTGTTTSVGNPPPAGNQTGGYMLLVNADYVASEVYRQTITSLCPNTYYEFSAWVRNVCSRCGMDSLGRQFNAAMPVALQSGYPGVNPNLTFALNGMDIYSSGEVAYGNGWVKKGFVFKTSVTPQNYTLSIRNNSQGGGGNDWALDDVSIATCFPTMAYSPSVDPQVCSGNALSISDTVRSFYDNYTEYKWQYMPAGSSTWSDIGGTQGSASGSVQLIGGFYTFISTYTIPPSNTALVNQGDRYRLVVASNPDNLLYPDCSFSDPLAIDVTVNDCGTPLKTELLSFNGKLVNDKGELTWTTSKEEGPITYTIERSADGSSFSAIGQVNGYNDQSANLNAYSLIDPTVVTGKVFYRLMMTQPSGGKRYSRIIQLTNLGGNNIGLVSVINPFNYSLEFDIAAQKDSKVEVELLDLYGRPVRKGTYMIRTGTNALSLPNTENLPDGTYIFRVKNNDLLFIRKVLKKSF